MKHAGFYLIIFLKGNNSIFTFLLKIQNWFIPLFNMAIKLFSVTAFDLMRWSLITNTLFFLALLCSQFTTLPNQLGLERKKGDKKLTLLITDKECYFISLFLEKKKICGVQMVKSLKIFKGEMENDSHPQFFSNRKNKTHTNIYQSEIVDAWNFNLSFPACIMVG